MKVSKMITLLSDLDPSSIVLFAIDDVATYSIDQVEVKPDLVIFKSVD